MRITAVRESTVAIGAAMRNAAIAFDGMTASALAVITDLRVEGVPVVGYAFDSIGRYGKGGLLRDRFLPRLLAADPQSLHDDSGLIDPPRAVRVLMRDEKAGGHGERPGALGLIEAALWDARAKAAGEPLWRLLARRCGRPPASPSIEVYASCGHLRDGDDGSALRSEVAAARASGFETIKIKLSGEITADLRRIDAAQGLVADGRLAVDVNGALTAQGGRQWMTEVAARAPAWIEEPCSALDFALLGELSAGCPAPVATGENLFSFEDARNLLRYGGLRPSRDLVQVDISLAYGIGEYCDILALYAAGGWARSQFYPHAGHLFAAHAVAGLGLGSAEAAADASLCYGGFWDHAEVRRGRVRVPDWPGVGFEAKRNLYELLRPLGEA